MAAAAGVAESVELNADMAGSHSGLLDQCLVPSFSEDRPQIGRYDLEVKTSSHCSSAPCARDPLLGKKVLVEINGRAEYTKWAR